MLAFGGPQSVESALNRRRVLPAQRQKREAYRGGHIRHHRTLPASLDRGQVGAGVAGGLVSSHGIIATRCSPSSIVLPGLRKGGFTFNSPRESSHSSTRKMVDIPRVGGNLGRVVKAWECSEVREKRLRMEKVG